MGSWPLDLKKVNVEIFLSSRRNEKGTPLYWQKQVYHVLPVVGSSIISYNFEVISLCGNTNFPFLAVKDSSIGDLVTDSLTQ